MRGIREYLQDLAPQPRKALNNAEVRCLLAMASHASCSEGNSAGQSIAKLTTSSLGLYRRILAFTVQELRRACHEHLYGDRNEHHAH